MLHNLSSLNNTRRAVTDKAWSDSYIYYCHIYDISLSYSSHYIHKNKNKKTSPVTSKTITQTTTKQENKKGWEILVGD